MEENKIENNIIKNKNEAISELNKYLDTCLLGDSNHVKKANLLSYWLKNYVKYIEQEETFNSALLKEYSRGDVIKVNLGFNVGNEEGGLHYCVVLDKKNTKSCSTLTVIPLSSIKPSSKPRKTSVFLGDDIYITLQKKNNEIKKTVKNYINICKTEIANLRTLPENTEEEIIIKNYKIQQIKNIIMDNDEKLELSDKIALELNQMKKGTIALTNQITTISKQRIYNPKKDLDILSGIKISDEKMKLIDEKIKKLFIN